MLVLASYNIHRCYGRDGRHNPERIRQVLHQLGAHVVALQEVELLYENPGLLEFFCENTAWKVIPGLTLTRDSGHYGNALLTSLAIRSVRRIDLSQPGREPRGALHVTLEHHGFRLAVTATHLGLRTGERLAQVRRLLEVIRNGGKSSRDADARVLMGDLNDWLGWGRSRRCLRQYFTDRRAPASYPAGYPILSLDRIMVDPVGLLCGVDVVNNSLAKSASDHLPVVARLEIGAVGKP